ncbi:uncharacterized protein LOC123310936 [Coccinella septempunctata]|uniref:uncharacterized protein LOC123310936 n=1 Tax=Coccinella septempunctata TaxID=41139 RepID=UPI001D06D500|nr:uncharacterized protein LOC123310936 [Coccinella septempunctata]
MVLVRNGVPTEDIQSIREMSVEKVTEMVAVRYPEKNILLLAVYRVPDGDFGVFLDIFSDALQELCQLKDFRVVVAGDFNVDFRVDSTEKNRLLDLIETFGLRITTTEPSRMTKTSSKCIDNIMTNLSENDTTTETEELHFSDHRAQIFTYMHEDENHKRQEHIYKRNMGKKCIRKLRRAIREFDWESLLSGKSAQEAYTSFHDNLVVMIESFCPIQRKLVKKCKAKNSIPSDLKDAKNELEILALQAIIRREDTIYELYRRKKKQFFERLENHKRETMENMVSRAENKTKVIWRIINENVRSKRRQYPGGRLKVESISEYFSRIGEELSENLPRAEKSAGHYLKESTVRSSGSFFFNPITSQEVVKIINSLKHKTTMDVYGIPTCLIKQLAEEISDPLQMVLNKCVVEGEFPDKMKRAKIVPVFKGKCPNYRDFLRVTIYLRLNNMDFEKKDLLQLH